MSQIDKNCDFVTLRLHFAKNIDLSKEKKLKIIGKCERLYHITERRNRLARNSTPLSRRLPPVLPELGLSHLRVLRAQLVHARRYHGSKCDAMDFSFA